MSYHPRASNCYRQSTYQIWSLYLHSLRSYERQYKMSKMGWFLDDIIHLTLGMLLHYLGKLKLEIFCIYWRKSKQIAFLIASTFVIHPQILIFSVFKIVNLSLYCIANKIFHVIVLLLIFIGDQFLASEIRHRRHHCSVCQQSTWY